MALQLHGTNNPPTSVMEDTTMMDAPQGLFEELVFTIIPIGLTEDRQQQLVVDITTNGGKLVPFDPEKGRVGKLDEITHIISTSTDFPDYSLALDSLQTHVVKPTWVEDSMKVNKLKNPRSYSSDPALFMSEVVICCGDIPPGDQDAIFAGVVALGGQYSPVMSKTVTHVVVLDIEDPKAVIVLAKKLACHILLPHWFDDCLRVGRKLSEHPYTLPDPEILKGSDMGPILTVRASQQVREASDPHPTIDPRPASSISPDHQTPRAIRAFKGKKVMLGDDLQLNDRLKNAITSMIEAGGGQVVSKVQLADIYVCNFREGSDYVEASQKNKDVGNLSWLYYLITHDTWTNPMRRLLHYPRPRNGVPGFQGYKISISSYTGEARVFLENLVKASGAEFTKTFKQDNTHLIAAHQNSEKYEAAKEWGVNVINHRWLEDSYSRCKEQTLTDDRYTYFPPRANLGEVLGHTEIDRNAVEKIFFPASRKPGATVKIVSQLEVLPGSSAPKPKDVKNKALVSPIAGKTKRAQNTENVATPAAQRRIEEKENQTPGTGGSRGAKERALSKLHDAAPDIAKFEKEMKRKGGVIHGGRRDKSAEVEDKAKKSKSRESSMTKRSFDQVVADGHEGDTASELDEENSPKGNKKAKKLGPIKYRMMLSKDDRWERNTVAESRDKAKLREMGIHIVEDVKNVDILCAPKIVRTPKFISALACGPIIVASSFIDQALKENSIPPFEKHPLKDPDFLNSHGIDLDDAVVRARQNKRRLLKGWQIYCTAGGNFETYRKIIEANGGQCNMWRGQGSRMTASKRVIDTTNQEVSQNQEEDEGDVLYLISGTSAEDIKLWSKFRNLATKHDMIPRIVSTEWPIHIAMAQKIHFDPKWELDEEAMDVA
ncbi:hypothetical protein B0J11DRAFT_483490 [Dendryphion nanum]|uniref:BRCT domain-containing protein n=1 Tax=Dendryphion nanum TaxID=256645 RepID=A0A9P9E3D6_9PLEO|nr:hypothetical protein B0J11DRAFT_483490 [Dendryphion nanum]